MFKPSKNKFVRSNKKVLVTFGVLGLLVLGLGTTTALTMNSQDNRSAAWWIKPPGRPIDSNPAAGTSRGRSSDTPANIATKGRPSDGASNGGTNGRPADSSSAVTNNTTPPTTTTTTSNTTSTNTSNNTTSNSGSSSGGSSGSSGSRRSGSSSSTPEVTKPTLIANGCVQSNGTPSKTDFLTVAWPKSLGTIQVINISTDAGMPTGADRWNATATTSYFWNKDVRGLSSRSFNFPSSGLNGFGYAKGKSLPVQAGVKYYAYLWDGSKATSVTNDKNENFVILPKCN